MWYHNRVDTTSGRLAQLVEHLLDVQEVTGSSPVPSTKRKPLTKVRGFFVASATVSRQSRTVQDENRAAARSAVSKATVRLCLARGSQTRRNVYQGRTNPILYEKGFGYVFCLSEVLRCVYARTQENGKIPLYRGVLSWGECGILGLVQQIGSYMWRRIIMNTVRMILCGNVEDSRMNPSEKVGVVSVVFVSTEEEKIKNKLKKLQDKNPEKFYMEYVTPLDVDLTSLEHYPSIEISKNDLQ